MRDIRKEILEKLEEIEKKENVRVLYAVESGSRAWGLECFESGVFEGFGRRLSMERR